MHYNSIMMINKYINQLEDYAKKHDVKLVQMFKLAKVPTSTYYRAKNGVDLRFTLNTNFTRSAFFNVDVLSINESNNRAQFIHFPMGQIKKCFTTHLNIMPT